MDKIFEAKKKLITKLTQDLDKYFSDQSNLLYRTIIEGLIDNLETDNGLLKNTAANLRKITQIDQLYNTFIQIVSPTIIQTVYNGITKISEYNVNFFKGFYKSAAHLKAGTEKIQQVTLDRLGFGEKTRLVKGGFMESLLNDTGIRNEIKNRTLKEVAKGAGFKSLKNNLSEYIEGNKNTSGGGSNGVKVGAFQQHHRNYAYDVFVNVDRGESLLYANSLNLKAFFYEGSIIETSRNFCIERAGKLYTVDEAKLWINDPWIKKNFDRRYIASYDPVVDMGLFGCRHLARFVSPEVAIKIRPELKDYFK